MKSSASGLPSWRDVIEPHPDVAQGRYKNAEFAADLAQVSRGEGSYEYRDPVEFFARTYVTEGMSGLLVQGLKRVTGKDGEPVIQLKTAFGGGKTHSMLALYHAMRGNVSVDKVPNLKPVLAAAGLSALPRANVAVLVGTALDPTKSKRPVNFQVFRVGFQAEGGDDRVCFIEVFTEVFIHCLRAFLREFHDPFAADSFYAVFVKKHVAHVDREADGAFAEVF